jgi:uncharacterized membrane protein
MLALGCGRKATTQHNDWASNHATAPVVAPTPIPLEPPVETLRVPSSGLPCAVDDVLAAKCRRCHTVPTRHGAPFALLTWEDTHAVVRDRVTFEVMGRAVTSGFMPYNVQANPPVERLTDQEKQTIVDWVAAGAPRAACPPVPATSSSVRRAPKLKLRQ